MTSFCFRFHKLLQLRESQFQASTQAHQAAEARLNSTRAQSQHLQRQLADTSGRSPYAGSGPQQVQASQLLECHRYREWLGEEIEKLTRELNELNAVANTTQQHMLASRQELESLRKLRERDYLSWQKQHRRQEQAQHDQAASLRHTNSRADRV